MKQFGWFGILLGCLVCGGVANVLAQQMTVVDEAPVSAPVEVFGSANEGNGQRNSFFLEQQGENNPLGNPIQSYEQQNTPPVASVQTPAASVTSTSSPVVEETLPQNPALSPQESPQIVNKQIQNTLYESGGRIYDVQSYPADDVKYIEQPNLNPTITTYPAD